MPVNLGKRTGAISLAKGDKVTIDGTEGVTATVSFDKRTDYDVYALVLLKDGTEKVVSTFGSTSQPSPTPEVLGIRHHGDVARGGKGALNTETLTIRMTPEVDRVAVVAYSAQSNGTGSFRKYAVTCTVDNGHGTVVTIPADQANGNNNVYTCVPAIVVNTPDGVVIERVELYSGQGSENRPSFVAKPTGFFGVKRAPVAPDGTLHMDAGSKNLYK